jgi:RHS repeat-associated protein
MHDVSEIVKDFAARESHTETGLYDCRVRYYDPNAGRFINEDPAGFDLFASLMEFDLKDIFVILEIRVVCKDGPAAS